MLIKITSILFSSIVLACSDCFSKCTNDNKNLCLLDCGCPLFTSSKVFGGSFQGQSGQLYVPDLDRSLSAWVSSAFSCNLECGSQCSSQYLDSGLESCVKNCGCAALLSPSSLKENIESKCKSICRGSPAGCAVDCYGHIEGYQSQEYLWLVFPVLLGLFLIAWLAINNKKEDDYVLM